MKLKNSSLTYTRKYPHCDSVVKCWTKEEEELLLSLNNQGFTKKEIAKQLGRTYNSVSLKLKRLKKKDKSYNAPHIVEKNKINEEFVRHINPSSVLDVYSGESSIYKEYNVITNDKNKEYSCDYNLDGLKLLCKLYYDGEHFDLIDLDPFGSCYDNLDLAVKLADKGLCVTLGEMGHKRWRRLDFVEPRYHIHSLEEFTTVNLIKEIQNIGIQNKKQLIVYDYKEWTHISRVWFEIKPYKNNSLWKNNLNEHEDRRLILK